MAPPATVGAARFQPPWPNQGITFHLLKILNGHCSIQTTAAYFYSNPNLLEAAIELA